MDVRERIGRKILFIYLVSCHINIKNNNDNLLPNGCGWKDSTWDLLNSLIKTKGLKEYILNTRGLNESIGENWGTKKVIFHFFFFFFFFLILFFLNVHPILNSYVMLGFGPNDYKLNNKIISNFY